VKIYNAVNFKIDKNIAYFDIRKGTAQKNNRGSNFNLLSISFVVERIIEILRLKRFKSEKIVIFFFISGSARDIRESAAKDIREIFKF
jgi:hypothetical protein